jgi:hypothetical protein
LDREGTFVPADELSRIIVHSGRASEHQSLDGRLISLLHSEELNLCHCLGGENKTRKRVAQGQDEEWEEEGCRITRWYKKLALRGTPFL